jgi:2-C-methyl-D-erythritol 4-phosphate cytidylyltransferase
MGVIAVVLAAGRGERLGGRIPKAFVPLRGKSLLVRSLEALSAVDEVDALVPVVAADDLDRFGRLDLGHLAKLAAPVVGGAERQDSVRRALARLPKAEELVAIHDAARCLVDPADVSRAIAVARRHGAAILAQPVRDTLKRVQCEVIVETPDRRECWAAQTPQVFRLELLREAMAKAEAEGLLGTDDAQLVEHLGVEVRIVEGSTRNIKITTPEDLAVAEAWLREAEAGGGR